jgi:hypothetical protein
MCIDANDIQRASGRSVNRMHIAARPTYAGPLEMFEKRQPDRDPGIQSP